MNKLCILVLWAVCSLTLSGSAQDTNMLKTKIGVFESRTGLVIIKAFSQVGSILTSEGEIAIRCKESTEAASGIRAYGMLFAINGNPTRRERIYVDYDEIDPLLDAVNYLSAITSDVTKLPAFEASYTTKSGLRIQAHCDRRNASIRYFLEYGESPRIELTPVQMTQIYDLIAQAKKALDGFKTKQ